MQSGVSSLNGCTMTLAWLVVWLTGHSRKLESHCSQRASLAFFPMHNTSARI